MLKRLFRRKNQASSDLEDYLEKLKILIKWEQQKTKNYFSEKIETMLNSSQQEFSRINQIISQNEEQFKKNTRLCFKNHQELMTKLNEQASINQKVEQLLALNGKKEKQLQNIAQGVIEFLDSIDQVAQGLSKQDFAWAPIIKHWQKQQLQMLANLNIYEMSLRGEIFNAQKAVALKTVNPAEVINFNHNEIKPYQIVDVIKRGFVDRNNNVIRKAQVITVREVKNEQEKSIDQSSYSWD